MTRIQPVNHEETTGKAKELLDASKSKLGKAPNMVKTMAQSSAVLEGYLNFSGALGRGKLNAKLREQIALVSAEINNCSYCASAHSAIGKMAGLSEDAILRARRGQASDAKTGAALRFASTIIVNRGELSDADLQAVRAAGFDDGEVAEIVGNVALNIFTNYFNRIAGTEIDFPIVRSIASR